MRIKTSDQIEIKTDKKIEVGDVFIFDKTMYICDKKNARHAFLKEIDWDVFFVERSRKLEDMFCD